MPPRQRPLDDSRSEASSGNREKLATAAKNRRTANAHTSSNAAPSRDVNLASGAPADGAEVDHNETRAQISWSSMPLSVLHDYRHAYDLSTPSAYSSQINSILLSQGIGLRSPTTLAARRAQASTSSKPTHKPHASKKAFTTTASSTAVGAPKDTAQSQPPSSSRPHNDADLTSLHRVQAQDRVSKSHLATAVRKHFNNVAISEQDAIAKFLYKVREDRKGREFRLKFQP